jgi:predicted HAD superfamily Cof-like phosphohydrolase
MVIELKNDGDTLKAEIANTDLNGTGQVKSLINKVYFYEGRVSAWGGGTWTCLHDVQDALIAKIKETGQSAFTVPEQAAKKNSEEKRPEKVNFIYP